MLRKRIVMRPNWTKRSIAAASAACVIIAGASIYLGFERGKTANASPAPELLSELPAGAPTLVYLDLAAIRASSFYQHKPDNEGIPFSNPDYANFVLSTGFNFEKDLDRVAVASWPPSGKEQRKNVAIAEGRFDRAKIREYAMREGKLDHQQGREVFLFPAGDRMESDSLTFLDDHHIAIVQGPSIAAAFAPHSDDPAADPARERATRVDGAAAFAITRVPPIPDNFAPGGAQSAQLASLAKSVQWVTLAARPEGNNLRISLEGECDNSTDAIQIKSTLELLRMFGLAGIDNPKTRQSMDPAAFTLLQNLLSGAEVTQAAERVRILVEVTPDIFKLGNTITSK
jgi:hypothetical protein